MPSLENIFGWIFFFFFGGVIRNILGGFSGIGAMILVFTVPVLFMAIVGCLYLHLGKELSGIYMGRYGLFGL